MLDDVDLPNRRITLAGHRQRLGDLTHRAICVWLDHRRATWPNSPNQHVIISKRTSHGTGPVSHPFVRFSLGDNGFSIDRIRADRILHEALTGGSEVPGSLRTVIPHRVVTGSEREIVRGSSEKKVLA